MTALDEILAWSVSAPDWLRDALRRIVTTSELSESDVAELVELCKAPHGLAANPGNPICLSANHVPVAPTLGDVCVSAVMHVADVNALAPNETLSFSPSGLTVIYGDNGAGKSGFTRILRRACRARGGNDPILANALSDKPASAPTARIDYTITGVPRTHTWKDGISADAELSAISVFDTAAAQVYVEDKTEVRFRPFGLDVMDRAATVCVRVKQALDAEIAALRASALKLPTLTPNTEAGRLVATLTALTAHAEVDRLGILSPDEQKELDNLTDLLAAAKAEDPKKKAADLRLKASRIGRLMEDLRELATALEDKRVDRVLSLSTEAAAAAEEARRFADAFTKELALGGVGGVELSHPLIRPRIPCGRTRAS